jgi:hypothetical protein
VSGETYAKQLSRLEGTHLYKPTVLIIAGQADAALAESRQESWLWHDRATEAQAERDAAREERDALRAAVEAAITLLGQYRQHDAQRTLIEARDAAIAERAREG